MGEDRRILTLNPVPDLDGTLNDDSLRDMDKGTTVEAGPMECCKFLRSKARLGGHEVLTEQLLMILGCLLQRKK